MQENFDVIAMGELLMDFTNAGVSEQGNLLFEANPGGAPCNVLAMLKQYGHKTAFIGKVGDDLFGSLLRSVLDELSIDTSQLSVEKEVRTTLAFVNNQPDGERDFSFFRNPGADMMLQQSDFDERIFSKAKIFHFGTLSMTHEPVRSATQYAIDIAEKQQMLISFDPNLRESLWSSKADAKEQVVYGLQHCQILKLSREELYWLTEITDCAEAISLLQREYGIPLILISLGENGSRAYCNDIMVEVGAFIQADTVDTTGAGDTFFGSCLHFVLKYGLEQLQQDQLKEMLTYANAAAAIITTRKGALRSMPRIGELDELIKRMSIA